MLSFVVRVLAFTEDLPCVDTYGGDADFRATFGGQPEPGAGKGRSGPITVALKKATRAADRSQSYLASYIATDTIGLGLYSQQE